jgi:hypothetical protein
MEHDLRWLADGADLHGCCEPLDGKAELLADPRLRRSRSRRGKTERAVETIGPHWVVSRKPNPAIFAEDDWNPDRARRRFGFRKRLGAATWS